MEQFLPYSPAHFTNPYLGLDRLVQLINRWLVFMNPPENNKLRKATEKLLLSKVPTNKLQLGLFFKFWLEHLAQSPIHDFWVPSCMRKGPINLPASIK